MFLFIDVVGLRAHAEIKFKYILCSYLSDASSDVAAEVFYLNTSYVLIYRYAYIQYSSIMRFKYILCSYLSPAGIIEAGKVEYLNTSYVLIYLLFF